MDDGDFDRAAFESVECDAIGLIDVEAIFLQLFEEPLPLLFTTEINHHAGDEREGGTGNGGVVHTDEPFPSRFEEVAPGFGWVGDKTAIVDDRSSNSKAGGNVAFVFGKNRTTARVPVDFRLKASEELTLLIEGRKGFVAINPEQTPLRIVFLGGDAGEKRAGAVVNELCRNTGSVLEGFYFSAVVTLSGIDDEWHRGTSELGGGASVVLLGVGS